MRASHLLIKHSGSRNPVSRRTGASTADISRDQAVAELNSILKVITKENFAQMSQERSDCGSFAQGGDLGEFGPGAMMKPFEEAVLALQVGEISGLVDTDSGTHLVMRTG
jgi:parvulin-like peptidyl-prolyl isomerase